MMQTFSDIIDAFDGYAGIASAIGCPPGTASSWKSRRSIPPRYWSKIADAARDRGIAVSADTLAQIAAKPPSDEMRRVG